MTLRKLVLTSLSATALAAGTAACGSSSNTGGSSNSTNAPAATASGKPTAATAAVGKQSGPVHVLTGGGLTVAGDDPVDTVIAIDLTTLTHGDPSLATAYKSTALQAAAPTIQRGGLIALEAFGRVASKAVNIYTTQVPTLAEAGPAARDNAGETANLTAALNVALGLSKPPTATAAQALYQVTHPEGSDIGTMIGDSIEQLSSGAAPIRDVLVETDGYVIRQAQPPLSQVLAQHGPAAAAAQIVANANVPPGTRPITMLMVTGLGSTSGTSGPGAKSIGALQSAYGLACDRLPSQECYATAEA